MPGSEKPLSVKLYIFFILLLATNIIPNASSVRAGSLSSETKTKNGVPETSDMLLAGEGEATIIVKTNTLSSFKRACLMGMNGTAELEVMNHLFAAINVPIEDAESVIEELMSDEGVDSADFDYKMFMPPVIRGTATEVQEGRGNMRRDLKECDEGEDCVDNGETTSYGNGFVRARELMADTDLIDGMTQSNIKICVVDTGYSLGHEDLPNSSQHGVTGFSPYESSERWDVDVDNHGTHTAGIIGAIGNNRRGVFGINPDPTKFSFHITKGIRDDGSGSTAKILEAFLNCVDSGASIINLSLIGGPQDATAAAIYAEAYSEGALIIAAAGNGGNNLNSFPAAYPHVMSVGAVDQSKERAHFSQFNDQVEISGPGVDILSTFANDEYEYLSGTSFAAPHVAGVAALVWSYFPTCSNQQIRGALIKTAEDRGADGCDSSYGYGIVDAKAAFQLLKEKGCQGGDNPHPIAVGGCEQANFNPAPPRHHLKPYSTTRSHLSAYWDPLYGWNGIAGGCED